MFFPPQLTETWATAYFQTFIFILFFVLGVPALIYEISIKADIRRLVHRRLKKGNWLILSLLIGFLCISFVWLFQPDSIIQTLSSSWYVSVAITITIFSIIIFWWQAFKVSTRDRIVTALLKEALNNQKRIEKMRKREEKEIERQSRDNPLEYLRYLGENGEPGNEKNTVLVAIGKLAQTTQRKTYYDGDSLSKLGGVIDCIKKTVSSSPKTGSEDNYILALKILTEIYIAGENHPVPRDINCARSTLQDIAVFSIKTGLIVIADKVLELPFLDSNNVLHIGISALEKKNYYIAVKAFDKLESFAEGNFNKNTISEGVVTYNFLGLIAHFYSKGEAAKKRADKFLDEVRSNPNFNDIIEKAKDHFYYGNMFDTADILKDILVQKSSLIFWNNFISL